MSTQRTAVITIADLHRKRDQILAAAGRNGARNVRVYGSVARGEADERSDVDFLVDFEPGRSLFDLVRLINELGALLERHVDVVTEEELRPRNRAEILAEARPL